MSRPRPAPLFSPPVARRLAVGRASIAAAALLLPAAPAAAGTGSLSTTYAAGNGQNGNMFQVSAAVDLQITGLEVYTQYGYVSAGCAWELYTSPSSFTTVSSDASQWTLVGSGSLSSSAYFEDERHLIAPTAPIELSAGSSLSLYVTLESACVLNYTNGSTAGAVYVSDTNLSITEGYGVVYPFAGTFSSRISRAPRTAAATATTPTARSRPGPRRSGTTGSTATAPATTTTTPTATASRAPTTAATTATTPRRARTPALTTCPMTASTRTATGPTPPAGAPTGPTAGPTAAQTAPTGPTAAAAARPAARLLVLTVLPCVSGGTAAAAARPAARPAARWAAAPRPRPGGCSASRSRPSGGGAGAARSPRAAA